MDRYRRHRVALRRSRSPVKGMHRRSRSRSQEKNRRNRDQRRRSRDRKPPTNTANKSLRDKIKHGNHENFKITRNSRHEARKKHTSMSFNERFTDPKKEKFIAHDNITIGIERNIQGNYPAVIPESIDTSAVIVFRKRDDGDKPLCKRPEFRNDIDADDEKLELLNPSSTVASITHPVNNEWHNSRRENRKRSFSDNRLSERQNYSQNRRNDLPDFGKRKNKGRLETWQLNPDVVPKGKSYYEHDNRTDSSHSHRNNRGGLRSWQARNSDLKRKWNDSRQTKTDNDKWAHDKFGELEKNDNDESTMD